MTTDGTPEDDSPKAPDLTYPDAPWGVIDRWNSRRGPVIYGRRESLPGLDTDLAALAAAIVPEGESPPAHRLSHYKRKLWTLRTELRGKSELAVLNADLIVHLRRESFPDHAPALFRRVWAEHGQHLLDELPTRWLISSVITFGDFGETEPQRRLGLALNMLFSLMKLYEFERLTSGRGPDELFRSKRKRGTRLPLGMLDFGLDRGGLDYNLLAPIWQEALTVPVVGPLACALLDRLNQDNGTLFRRLQAMRRGKQDYLAKLEARAKAEEAAMQETGPDAQDPSAGKDGTPD
ncbi:MAG TPA: hypothetical protein VK146_12820 [Tabrizicola sp.]|nr:hypothetical protein [Tabrizicola sp.]